MQAAASLQTLNEYPPQAAAVTRSQSVSGLLIPPEGKVSCDKPCNVVALSQDLVSAIRNGESEQAQALSRQLAQVAANLAITPLEQLPPASISVKVIFEDVDSNLGFVVLDLRPNLTIAQLKWKMLVEHGLPPEVQVWIIRRRIPRDADTLELCGLKPGEEESIYLYLTSRKAAGLTESVYQRKYGILFGDDPNVSLTHDLEVVSLDTSAVGTPPAATQAPSPAGSDTVAAQETDPAGPLVIIPQGIPNTKPPSPQPQEQGWLCPRCTYFNIPTRPGCEMCADKRPADYVVPANFQVPQAERLRLEQERLLEQQLHEMQRLKREEEARERKRTLEQLHQVDQQDLVVCPDSFTCSICFMEIEAGEGVVLRDCLHVFCRECLAGYIQHNEESCIVCPYKDTYTCDVPLHEREIKALVNADVFGKYLQRGLTQAEGAMKNTFHCKTADCLGWCEYEDEVNFFDCPVCNQSNCLTCKAIHMGKNCKQYQDELRAEAMHNQDAQKSNEAIQQMLRNGDAMNCPGCGVVVQKKEGCDWLKCSMCRTEICWVTRGPRWGPGGTGDTSGGCRCRANGAPCHPNCGNCH